MVKTGIKKYDELPARVGISDVDAMRYSYLKYKNKLESIEQKLEKIVNQTK